MKTDYRKRGLMSVPNRITELVELFERSDDKRRVGEKKR